MYDFIGGPNNSLINLKSLCQPVLIICIVSHVLYFNFNKISTSTLENKKNFAIATIGNMLSSRPVYLCFQTASNTSSLSHT